MSIKLTSNVLKRIGGKEFSNDCGSNTLIIFCGAQDDFDTKKFIESFRGSRVSLGFSFMAEKILDTHRFVTALCPDEIFHEEDVLKSQYIVQNYSVLVIPNITLNTLSKTALGMIDSFASNILWSFLHLGKKVNIDFNSAKQRFGIESNSHGIKRVISTHIATLIDMGAAEIRYETMKVHRRTNASEILDVDIGNLNQISHKVITEKDIMSLKGGTKKVYLGKGDIVTPLAKDRARALGIEFEIK